MKKSAYEMSDLVSCAELENLGHWGRGMYYMKTERIICGKIKHKIRNIENRRINKMIFDTHAHYDDEQFDTDRDELLSSMAAGGVGTIVDAAATVESWDKIVELAEKYSFIYGSVGVHPGTKSVH